MELKKALEIAKQVKAALKPYCTQIEIGGSVRRRVKEVKDIEIICAPKRINEVDLFGDASGSRVHLAFIKAVKQWQNLRGGANGRYTQRQHPAGIKLDIFISMPKTFGYHYAIRTGPAEYSRQLVMQMSRCNLLYNKDTAEITKFNKVQDFKTEVSFLDAINFKFERAEKRI